jgi:FkbM family methyltransferase
MFLLNLFMIYQSIIYGQEVIHYSLTDNKGIFLDQKIYELFNFENGIFIEVGALDGITQSNTMLLEKFYNWKGILIEPSQNIFDKLVLNRPKSKCFQTALGKFKDHGKKMFGDFDGHPMSSLTNRLNRPKLSEVNIRSLQSILDECNIKHINFFSLDTEGYEYNILKGIDFNKTKFDYILIEIYNKDFDKIVKLLKNNGYELIECFSNYNKEDNPFWDGSHNDYLFKYICKN